MRLEHAESAKDLGELLEPEADVSSALDADTLPHQVQQILEVELRC